MAIAGMVVWALTVGIGIYLVAAGIAAQRAVIPQAGRPAAARSAQDGAAVVGTGALEVVLGSEPATAAAPTAEGSPLLEFTHPALALVGLTFWIFFVMTGDRPFAWIAFGIVVATAVAGMSWDFIRRRTAARRGREGPDFPRHLILAHALAAACTLALVVISALAASR